MEVACPICKKEQMCIPFRTVKEVDKTYNVYLCEMCKVGVTIPFPSSSELSSLYSSGTYRSASGKRFVGMVETGIYMARHIRRKRIEKYKEKGRILDLVCRLLLEKKKKKNRGVK